MLRLDPVSAGAVADAASLSGVVIKGRVYHLFTYTRVVFVFMQSWKLNLNPESLLRTGKIFRRSEEFNCISDW